MTTLPLEFYVVLLGAAGARLVPLSLTVLGGSLREWRRGHHASGVGLAVAGATYLAAAGALLLLLVSIALGGGGA